MSLRNEDLDWYISGLEEKVAETTAELQREREARANVACDLMAMLSLAGRRAQQLQRVVSFMGVEDAKGDDPPEELGNKIMVALVHRQLDHGLTISMIRKLVGLPTVNVNSMPWDAHVREIGAKLGPLIAAAQGDGEVK